MALLLMLVERKDTITTRLSQLEEQAAFHKEIIIENHNEQEKADKEAAANMQSNLDRREAVLEEEHCHTRQQKIEEASQALRWCELEQEWLLRHVQITNEAIVPVLNVTRLKQIKNSPFTDKSVR